MANALESLKQNAAWVTQGERGAGVAELVDRLLADDLADLDAGAPRQLVDLATSLDPDQPEALSFLPRRQTLLLVGASGSGKSTLTFGVLERLQTAGFQYCIIDPEGDYEASVDAVSVGTAETPPELGRVMDLLRRPGINLIVNLLAVPLADRPVFFGRLLPDLLQLRARTGRPHVLVVDEAHHMLPADWDPGAAHLPEGLDGVLFVTVHPDRLSHRALDCISRLLVVGRDAALAATAFCEAQGLSCRIEDVNVEPGQVLALDTAQPLPRVWKIIPSEGERRRHVRKYAEGKLGEDKSFWFRGAERKLNLRAHNLMLFVQISEGVDEETWEHHRRAGDYSRWIEGSLKDSDLAAAIADVEQGDLPAAAARQQVAEAINARYTLPG